jgi:hypothetical protein
LGDNYGKAVGAAVIEIRQLKIGKVKDAARELRRQCLADHLTAYDRNSSPIDKMAWLSLEIVLDNENMLWVMRNGQPAFAEVMFLRDDVLKVWPEMPDADDASKPADQASVGAETKAFQDHENAPDDRQRHADVARAMGGSFHLDRGEKRIRAVNWFIRRQQRTALEDRFWLCLTEIADEFSRRPGAFAVDDRESAAKSEALRVWILAGKFSIVLNVHPHVPSSELGRFRFNRDSAAIPELINKHLGDLWIKRQDCVAWRKHMGLNCRTNCGRHRTVGAVGVNSCYAGTLAAAGLLDFEGGGLPATESARTAPRL